MVRVATHAQEVPRRHRGRLARRAQTPSSSWRRSAAARSTQMDEQTRVLERVAAAAARGRGHPLPRAGRLHAGDRRVARAATSSTDIFPVLTPLAFDPGPPVPVHLEPEQEPRGASSGTAGRTKFARVKVPDMLPRFVAAAGRTSRRKAGHDVRVPRRRHPRATSSELFPGTQVEGAHLFRIIRDTDMVIQEDEADDLLETVDRGLKQLRYGALSLLQVEADMPRRVLEHPGRELRGRRGRRGAHRRPHGLRRLARARRSCTGRR